MGRAHVNTMRVRVVAGSLNHFNKRILLYHSELSVPSLRPLYTYNKSSVHISATCRGRLTHEHVLGSHTLRLLDLLAIPWDLAVRILRNVVYAVLQRPHQDPRHTHPPNLFVRTTVRSLHYAVGEHHAHNMQHAIVDIPRLISVVHGFFIKLYADRNSLDVVVPALAFHLRG